jgi:hypothetical protein
VVVAVADDGRTAERTVEAERGERVSVTIPLGPPIDDGDEEGTSSVFSSPWFWVATAVVVGAGVGLTIALTSGKDEPVTDPVFPTAETLRF